ncbi:hypothetical protein PVAP13_5NG447440 [Panicum virgatum]|uniref:Uncharacterized protein n=1 Tax=Panicum virgatum TaxID=38727 RepID=A0A8T0S1G9_PANVG|nr:hypothetical protein PVAP13_5NG447440 [Panicum virgatum]
MGRWAHCSRAQRIAHCVSEKRGTSLPSRRSARAPPPASHPNCRSRPPLLPLWCISGGRSTATTTTGADGDPARMDHPHRFSGGRRSSCKSRRRTRSSSPPALDLPLLRHHLQQVLLDSPLSISSPAGTFF